MCGSYSANARTWAISACAPSGSASAILVVSGAAWQFKGWPFKGLKEGGHTVDLFSKVAGVFVGYADEEPPAAVKTWNVSRFGLHREARHRDRSVASAVWRAIDAMVASKKAREFG